MKRSTYVLGSAATLLGVSLVIVTAVHITDKSATTWADELSFAAALLFLVSCLLSHRAIATGEDRFERIADKFFATAIFMLLFGAVTFWF